jgi:hypothetical protein
MWADISIEDEIPVGFAILTKSTATVGTVTNYYNYPLPVNYNNV